METHTSYVSPLRYLGKTDFILLQGLRSGKHQYRNASVYSTHFMYDVFVDAVQAFLRTLPSQFVTIVPFPGRTWGYVHDIRHGLRKRRSLVR